jgi:S1-C subfamily serine protease
MPRAPFTARVVITSLAGQPTPTSDALSAVLAGLKPGQRVSVAVVTPAGASRTLNVTLGQLAGNVG